MNRKERRAAAKTGIRQAAGADELMAEARRLYQSHRTTEAQDLCEQVIAREPLHVHALNMLGLIAQEAGKHKFAVKMFARALAVDDLNAACHFNIANSCEALQRRADAAEHFRKSIAFGMNDRSAEEFILKNPVVAALLGRISSRWPLSIRNEELFGSAGIAPLAADLLLRTALETVCLGHAGLELLLGHVRFEMLNLAEAGADAGDDVTDLACVLARQCFLNEYVYALSEDETARAAKLRDLLLEKLDAGGTIPVLLLAVVAAYAPLHELPHAGRLLARDWPEPARGLLRQQVREPLEEAGLRGQIAVLTAVDDDISRQVMQQYEENPYPRWTVNPVATFVVDRIRGKTGDVGAQGAPQEILIAGCGTGQQAVQTAQLYPQSTLLAVDISRASLAYAQRKTRELGLANVEYAQADILKLGTIGRSFDRIDCIGVLHHLADPEAGWRVLLGLLRPHGQMRVGLYSETARRSVVAARARIAEGGYRATTGDIRRFRQDIMREPDHRRWQPLLGARDFYTTSGCRDLLFNVMERRFTIPRIATFLQNNALELTRFEFAEDPSVIEKFRQRFPGDDALTDLGHWHDFEQSNPDTFWGMYVFSLRRKPT